MSKAIAFDDYLLSFMADCMCVAEMNLDRASSIKEMARRANTTFKDYTPTPARKAEVKKIILEMA